MRDTFRAMSYAKMGGNGGGSVAHVVEATALIAQKMKLDEQIR